MKTLISLVVLTASLAAIATAADARPHKVCFVHHHHRACHWVR